MVVVLWTGGYNPVIQVPIGRKENREMKIFRNMVLVVVICSDVMVPPTPLNGHVVGVDDRGVLIAFDYGIDGGEAVLVRDTIRKTNQVLRSMGFRTEDWSRHILVGRSMDGWTHTIGIIGEEKVKIDLASVDARSISHEYATGFMPKFTQAIVEGGAEMVAYKVTGLWALSIQFPKYQSENWREALWWSSDNDPVQLSYPLWGKVTLAGQAALALENLCPGIWAYLGEKDKEARLRGENPGIAGMKVWVEEYWPGGWHNFGYYPILFTEEDVVRDDGNPLG